MARALISKSEWARNHGFSPQYVNKLINQKKIVTVDGKIDPHDADRRLAAFANVVRQATKPKKSLKPGPRPRVAQRVDMGVDLDEDDEEVDPETGLREDEL